MYTCKIDPLTNHNIDSSVKRTGNHLFSTLIIYHHKEMWVVLIAFVSLHAKTEVQVWMQHLFCNHHLLYICVIRIVPITWWISINYGRLLPLWNLALYHHHLIFINLKTGASEPDMILRKTKARIMHLSDANRCSENIAL